VTVRLRAVATLVASGFVLAACGSDTDPVPEAVAPTTSVVGEPAATSAPSTSRVPAAPVTVPQASESPREEDVPSGLDLALGDDVADLPAPLIPLSAIRSGGPPPDGIPSIDAPAFVTVPEVDFLSDDEAVMAVEIDGEARAYPLQILMWHEIVNDTIAGVPVAVTYCPLCNSALAYDRRVADRVVTFGTSGLLWNSALIMYDRQTESLWSHFTGQAVVGHLTGTELQTFPVATVSWRTWREAHPDGLVLSLQTGFQRDYGANPYPGYDDFDGRPFLFQGEIDGRFTAMTRMVGIERDGAAVGVPLTVLSEQRVVATELGGEPLVVFWEPGTASALDALSLRDGDDIGATGVFVPFADGAPLTFTPGPDGFVDDRTGSVWNLLGRAVSGPLAGTSLERVAHVDTFWFAWAAFQPDTALVQ
jgi:hypothetical protein